MNRSALLYLSYSILYAMVVLSLYEVRHVFTIVLSIMIVIYRRLTMYYTTIDNVPAEYKEIISRLVEGGIIASTDKLEHALSDDMLFILKVLVRKGIL